jgi:hypothetical protein
MRSFIAINHAKLPAVSLPMSYADRGSGYPTIVMPVVEKLGPNRCLTGETV